MENKKFGIINLIFLSLLVAIFAVIPTIGVATKNNLINKKFRGNANEYQGVISVWNVDTFEGGSSSKSDFLIKTGTLFAKDYNGIYFLVDNITPEEMVNNFANNIFPEQAQ